MRLARPVILALTLLGTSASRSGAQLAPYHHWRTLETAHFRVHARAGLEREARIAAAAAEKAYVQLARELTAPEGTVDLVVTDDADVSNGYATPLPSNRIVIYTTPPVDAAELQYRTDWVTLVVTHELTHIFHTGQARGPWAAGRRLFGRAPFFFPNLLFSPSWLTEGIAVYYESKLTGQGRLRDAGYRDIARAMAIEGRFPAIDQLNAAKAGFPGARHYIFGSQFVEYLARTRGDSAVPRLIRATSGEWNPFRLNHAAQRAFGTTLSDAYKAFGDSIKLSVAVEGSPLLAGAQQDRVWAATPLASRLLGAPEPRWLSDSSLVYSGGTGRETYAAHQVTAGGVRTRLGRRNWTGTNSPLATGGVLFAQTDFTSPQEFRSDLYIERDGHQTRLTHGAHLVQPDVRSDGHIVAVKIRATQTDLVVLTPDAREHRVLRLAAQDETWSQPRWSPDGRRIAAILHRHGGEFSLQVIDVASEIGRELDRASYTLTSPSWSRDGLAVLYTSEEFGPPQVVRALADGSARTHARALPAFATGVRSPELSPSGGLMSVVTLGARGFNVVAVPSASSSGGTRVTTALPPLPAPDSLSQALGDFHAYSAWNSARPTFWLPIIEGAPGGGTRLGAFTSGGDVVGRHAYVLQAATTTKGFRPTADLAYRFAGRRNPAFDVRLLQDWTALNTLVNGGTTATVGTLLRSSRDASLAATFVRPRVRAFSALSVGAGVEHRRFETDPAPLLVQFDTSLRKSYLFPRFSLGAQWSNTQRPHLAISREDGVSLALTARERWRADRRANTASASLIGSMAGYKSLDLPGYAHHVLALRVAGGIADRQAATAMEVGGTSGSSIDIFNGATLGEGRRTFGVRGFHGATIFGTRAAAGSLEYRAPLTLTGRGYDLLPFFFDRSSVSFFADAGVAACASAPLFVGICSPAPRIGRTIGSVGGELALAVAFEQREFVELVRFGIAVPVVGRELAGAKRASFYVAFGPSF